MPGKPKVRTTYWSVDLLKGETVLGHIWYPTDVGGMPVSRSMEAILCIAQVTADFLHQGTIPDPQVLAKFDHTYEPTPDGRPSKRWRDKNALMAKVAILAHKLKRDEQQEENPEGKWKGPPYVGAYEQHEKDTRAKKKAAKRK